MRDRVLSFLKEKMPDFVSGENISKELGVSRTAVWKYINTLKSKGYKIEASPKKGYRLALNQDVLDSLEIKRGLYTQIGKEVIVLEEVDSTNNYAKKIAVDSEEDGVVILVENQTAGKGRLGRKWDSATGKGIWMSVVLRPTLAPHELQLVTLASAVAVVKALRKSTGLDFGIKWPNDIILGMRKVCGILVEMVSESERIDFIILGIGLNVSQTENDFSQDLIDKAISIKSFCMGNSVDCTYINRNSIVKELIIQLDDYYNKIEDNGIKEIIDEWKDYSVTLNNPVKFSIRDIEYTGIPRDISPDGRLIVECDDGTVRQIVSGEISVRGILGYI